MRTLALRHLRNLALGVGLISVGHPAQAQLLTNPVQDYINKTNLLNNILSNARATDMSQKSQVKGGGPNASSVPKPAAPAPTEFTPSSPVLPKVLAEKAASPAERQQAEQLFASLVQLYEQTAKKDGFPPNDLAYAFEYFVVNSYLTYHDLHEVDYNKDPRVKRGKDGFDRIAIIHEKKAMMLSLDHERAVYQQLRNALSGHSAVQQMSDRQKQEIAELLAIVLGLNFKTYMRGVDAEDDRMMAQARQAAKLHLEKLTGAPIERIKIDSSGLHF